MRQVNVSCGTALCMGRTNLVGLFERRSADLGHANVADLSLIDESLERLHLRLNGNIRIDSSAFEEVQFLLSIEGAYNILDTAANAFGSTIWLAFLDVRSSLPRSQVRPRSKTRQ